MGHLVDHLLAALTVALAAVVALAVALVSDLVAAAAVAGTLAFLGTLVTAGLGFAASRSSQVAEGHLNDIKQTLQVHGEALQSNATRLDEHILVGTNAMRRMERDIKDIREDRP